MNQGENLFVGQTERMLLSELREKKLLRYEKIYGCYTVRGMGRSFIQKLLTLKVAKITAPETLTYIE